MGAVEIIALGQGGSFFHADFITGVIESCNQTVIGIDFGQMRQFKEVLDFSPVLFAEKQADDMDFLFSPFGCEFASRHRDHAAVSACRHEIRKSASGVVIRQSQSGKALFLCQADQFFRCHRAIRKG